MAFKFSELDFLRAIFHPKTAPALTGLRKRTRTGKQWNKSRLKAFNGMPREKQEALRRSGLEEKYLRGEATQKNAKDALRITAVKEKIAKPVKKSPVAKLKSKTIQIAPLPMPTATELGMRIVTLVMERPYKENQSEINLVRIRKHAEHIVDNEPSLARPIMICKTYAEYMKLIKGPMKRSYQYEDDEDMSYLYYH